MKWILSNEKKRRTGRDDWDVIYQRKMEIWENKWGVEVEIRHRKPNKECDVEDEYHETA